MFAAVGAEDEHMPWMTEVRAHVERRLRSFLDGKRAWARDLPAEALPMLEGVADLTLRGGKRLRPVLSAAGLWAVKPDAKPGDVASLGAALELLQSYLLIHDDWMDQDVERRGAASVHAGLAAHTGDAHLGACLGVLAGDLANTYAWELLASTDFPPGRLGAALAAFAVLQQEVLFGQALDVLGAGDITRMQQLKTGSYTTVGPLRLGGLLGGASPEQLTALGAFGEPLGEAFQLRDDILGTFGKAGATGKPVGSDLRAGKRTALMVEAEQRLTAEQHRQLRSVWGDDDATEVGLAGAADLLERSGVRAAVEARLEALMSQARSALDNPAFSAPGRERLGAVAELMTARSH